MKYIVIFILVILIGDNYAQVPGYMGKRFSVEGDINILPHIGISESDKRDALVYDEQSQQYNMRSVDNSKHKLIRYNLNTGISLSYTLSRKLSVSLNYNYMRRSFVLLNEERIATKEDVVPYFTKEFGVNFKFYSNNFIAPVGRYISLGVGSSISSTLKEGFVIQSVDIGYGHQVYTEDVLHGVLTLPKFTVGFGENKVFNRFFFKYEGILNFYVLAFPKYKYSSANGGYPRDYVYLFRDYVGKDLKYINFINFKVSVGMLF